MTKEFKEDLRIKNNTKIVSTEAVASESPERPEKTDNISQDIAKFNATINNTTRSQKTTQLIYHSNNTENSELRNQCLTALPKLKAFHQDSFSHAQEDTIGIAVFLLILLFLGVPIVAVYAYLEIQREGFKQDLIFRLASIIPLLMLILPQLLIFATMLANWLNDKHCYRAAEVCHHLAVNLNKFLPNSSETYVYSQVELINYYLSLGKASKAASTLEILSSKSAKDDLELATIVKVLYAHNLALQHKAEEAQEAIKEAIAFFESNANSNNLKRKNLDEIFHFHIATAHSHCGKYIEALNHYQIALQSRLNNKTASRNNIAVLTAQTAYCHYKLNDLATAREWAQISLEASQGTRPIINANIQALSIAGQIELAAGNLSGLEFLDSAHKLSKTWKIYPDLGGTQQALGLHYAQNNEWQKAKVYHQCSIAIRNKQLTVDHPLAQESLALYIASLEGNGDTVDSLKAQRQLKSIINESKTQPIKTTVIKASFIKPKTFFQIRRNQCVLTFFFITAVFYLAEEGFRAAGPQNLGLAYLSLLIYTGIAKILWDKKKSTDKKKLLEEAKALPNIQIKACITKTDKLKLNCRPYLAKLGSPINQSIYITNDFNLLDGNMQYFSQEREYTLITSNEQPLFLESEHGLIELFNKDNIEKKRTPPLNELIKVTAITIGFISFFPVAFLPLAIAGSLNSVGIIQYDPDKPAKGLTSFEYYRYGAHRLEYDSKNERFTDLAVIKKAFEEAEKTTSGKPDFFGELANRCSTSELPAVIPKAWVLDSYEMTLNDKLDASHKKERLRNCIKQEPKFDWAYTNLAQIYLSEQNLPEAETLLKKAAAINPQSLNYLYTMANLEKAKRTKEKAMATLWHALKIDPFNPRTYHELVSTYFIGDNFPRPK